MRATSVTTTLSELRLHRFLVAAGGSRSRALRLYRWNAQLASAYWTPLHFMEVAVRNAVNDAMERSAGNNWWFQGATGEGAPWLYRIENDAVTKAYAKLLNPTPGKVVAELHFGFWVGLLSGRYLPMENGADYHDLVWVKGGVAQKFGGAKRSVIYKRLTRLRLFRNRIAHHEHLMNENLNHVSDDIDAILRQLCPDTATWVRAMSNVAEVRHNRPM